MRCANSPIGGGRGRPYSSSTVHPSRARKFIAALIAAACFWGLILLVG